MSDDVLRLLVNLIRYGTVASVDTDAARVVVHSGDLVTRPLRWISLRAGDVAAWSPPSVGEQVVILSPYGEPAAGVVLTGLFSSANPKPAEATAVNALIAFNDGARLIYDRQAHALHVTLPAGGKVDVTASGGVTVNASGGVTINGKVTINGDVQIQGEVHASGDIASDGDVTAGAISLKNHKHPGVQSGGSTTGPAQ